MSERLFTQAEVSELLAKTRHDAVQRTLRFLGVSPKDARLTRRGDVKPMTFNEGESNVGS